MDDLEGAGIGVVDADLLARQRMLDQLVLYSLVGQGSCRVEAKRLEVASKNLHCRYAAGLNRLHELGARGERKVLAAPQSQPLRVGEIVHSGGPGGRDIHDPGVGQRVLQAQAGPALLRRRLVAPLALAAGGIGHRMAFVEHDHSIEVRSQPVDDLPDPRNSFLACVGP